VLQTGDCPGSCGSEVKALRNDALRQSSRPGNRPGLPASAGPLFLGGGLDINCVCDYTFCSLKTPRQEPPPTFTTPPPPPCASCALISPRLEHCCRFCDPTPPLRLVRCAQSPPHLHQAIPRDQQPSWVFQSSFDGCRSAIPASRSSLRRTAFPNSTVFMLVAWRKYSHGADNES
jgi:hypothetical protein